MEDAADFGRDRLVRVLRRWAAAVVLAGIIGAGAAYVASALQVRQYEAAAQLYIAPATSVMSEFRDVMLGQYIARTFVQLATSDVVMNPAIESLRLTERAGQPKVRVEVTHARDTSILYVKARSTDPGVAAEAANAVAGAFIAHTRTVHAGLQGTAVSELGTQIGQARDEVQALGEQIASLQARAAATPRPGQSQAERAELQAQITQLESLRQSRQLALAQLLRTRDEMRVARARAESTVSVWSPAREPQRPMPTNAERNALLGGLSGMLIVVIGLAILAYFDDRVTDSEEVQRRLRIPALGQVGLHDHPETTRGKLFLRDEAGSPDAEAIRGIRTNITFARAGRPPRSILVTSALPGEGKSVLSANLALAFAEAGTRVVLIDADLRRPSQHRLFGAPQNIGLSRMLAGASGGEPVPISENLYLITSGPLPPNPTELLGSDRMSAILEELAAIPNGLVIIDSSPLLAVADPAVLATKAEACLLVVDSSRTRVPVARRGLLALERVRAPIIGAVLNKVARGEAAYYRYAGYYDRTERQRQTGRVGGSEQRGAPTS